MEGRGGKVITAGLKIIFDNNANTYKSVNMKSKIGQTFIKQKSLGCKVSTVSTLPAIFCLGIILF